MAYSQISNCALLFGTPIDYDEFMARAAARPPSHYLLTVIGHDPPELAWRKYYEKVARAGMSLALTAESLGATVYRGSTLRDFALASTWHSCLILMTHWRGALISFEDLLAPPEEILAFIQAGTHPVLEWFRSQNPTRATLIDVFNRALNKGAPADWFSPTIAAMAQLSSALERTLCRDLLEEVFNGMLARGNRIELFDGLHSLAAMEQALAADFRGELDLATCHSEAFAVYIDLLRNNTIRHLHWPVAIDPVPQYILIAETLRRLSVSGGSYISMRLSVEEEVSAYRNFGEVTS